MPTMTVLRGIPGSGKSTWRNEKGMPYVNLDELRQAFPGDTEKQIRNRQDTTVQDYLNSGIDFIIDNTHVQEYSYSRYVSAAKAKGYDVIVKEFKPDIMTCLDRNEKRSRVVPFSVILRMAHDFGYNLDEQYFAYTTPSSQAVIIDLDGTLCNIEHRLHHVKKDPKDWNNFFAGIPQDTINVPVMRLLMGMYDSGTSIILVSGRSEDYRDTTEQWLKDHLVPFHWLLMRKFNDLRDDTVVKAEIYTQYIQPYFNVQFCVDDRPSVCRTWRSLGLFCLQIQEQEF